MFEKASRIKLRFEHRGLCSVEDLWDLDLEILNDLYKKLKKLLREESVDGLLVERTKSAEIIELKVNIVKHIVLTRLAEKEAAVAFKLKADKKQRILSIIAEKQDSSLKEMSIDELNSLIAEL